MQEGSKATYNKGKEIKSFVRHREDNAIYFYEKEFMRYCNQYDDVKDKKELSKDDVASVIKEVMTKTKVKVTEEAVKRSNQVTKSDKKEVIQFISQYLKDKGLW